MRACNNNRLDEYLCLLFEVQRREEEEGNAVEILNVASHRDDYNVCQTHNLFSLSQTYTTAGNVSRCEAQHRHIRQFFGEEK